MLAFYQLSLDYFISFMSYKPPAFFFPFYFSNPLLHPVSHSHLQEPHTLTFMPGSPLPLTHIEYAQIFADM